MNDNSRRIHLVVSGLLLFTLLTLLWTSSAIAAVDVLVSVPASSDGANGGNILFTDVPVAGPWNVSPAELDAVGGNILIQATNDSTFDDTLNLTAAGATLTVDANNAIVINANVTTNGGDQAYNDLVTLGAGIILDTGTGPEISPLMAL